MSDKKARCQGTNYLYYETQSKRGLHYRGILCEETALSCPAGTAQPLLVPTEPLYTSEVRRRRDAESLQRYVPAASNAYVQGAARSISIGCTLS
jgi:hypothetical protein